MKEKLSVLIIQNKSYQQAEYLQISHGRLQFSSGSSVDIDSFGPADHSDLLIETALFTDKSEAQFEANALGRSGGYISPKDLRHDIHQSPQPLRIETPNPN